MMNTNMTASTPETEVKTCARCGCIIEGEVIVIDGETYCRDCVVQCDDCGEYFNPDREYLIEYEDKILCESCRENRGLVKCEDCGAWFNPEHENNHINAGWGHTDYYLCDPCLERAVWRSEVFFCDDCQEYYDIGNVSYTILYDGDTLCDSCCSDADVTYCEDCGEYYRGDEMRYSEENDRYYCRNCYRDRPRNIHDYGFKPYPCFHGVNRDEPHFGDPLTMGFELEVDNGASREDCAGEINSEFGDEVLYMKNDSSVDFEIVTHPHTLDAYKEFDFAKLCRIPLAYGYKSHDAGTCGFHIHVGRTQLAGTGAEERDVINKIALLMYRHWDSLVVFSRRRESQLNRWAAKPDFNFSSRPMTEAQIMQVVDDCYRYHDRYRALNLENRSTIEFRLWRGSLAPTTLLATIQLTSNIVRYAMTHSVKEVVMSDWIDVARYETCPALEDYLAERDLTTNRLAPAVIPYAENATPTTTSPVNSEFSEGDYVQIVMGSELIDNRMVGARGAVTYHEADVWGEEERYLLRIDYDHPPSAAEYLTHGAGGRAPDGDGYWVRAENIARCDRETGVTVGDYVRITTGIREGELGTVVVIANNDSARFGICLDNPNGLGHNLNGQMPENLDQFSGWWVAGVEVLQSVAQTYRDTNSMFE